MRAPLPDAALRELAQQVADDLFVNGHGEEAGRLVLTVDGAFTQDERELGGWCKRAVEDRVFRILRKGIA